MKTLSLKIPRELFSVSESASFSGRYEPSELGFGQDRYRPAHPLEWSINLTNTGGELVLSGLIKGDLVTTCVRCLESYTLEVEGDIEGLLILPSMASSIPEDLSEDEYLILGDELSFDLEPFLRAALHLEVPLVPLCQEQCRGICPGCGVNLNEEPCRCPDGEQDRVDSAHPFAALAELDLSAKRPSRN